MTHCTFLSLSRVQHSSTAIARETNLMTEPHEVQDPSLHLLMSSTRWLVLLGPDKLWHLFVTQPGNMSRACQSCVLPLTLSPACDVRRVESAMAHVGGMQLRRKVQAPDAPRQPIFQHLQDALAP